MGELVLSLDHSVNAPFTHTMADLYAYALQRTVEGHSKQSEQAFQEALSILTTLSDTWAEVKRRVCEENHEPEASPEPRVPEPVAVELDGASKDPYAAICTESSGWRLGRGTGAASFREPRGDGFRETEASAFRHRLRQVFIRHARCGAGRLILACPKPSALAIFVRRLEHLADQQRLEL